MSTPTIHDVPGKNDGLAYFLKRSYEVDVRRCYQCGKCSAGCPLAYEMDHPPTVSMRLLQLRTTESDREVLRSKAIWLCLNCETCYVRCPMEIDIPKAMDALRQVSVSRRLVHHQGKRIMASHRAFLDSIRFTGRLFEVGMIADYKVRSGSLFQDLLVAPVMFVKGKLHLFPERIRQRRLMKRIFSRSRPLGLSRPEDRSRSEGEK